MHKLFAIDSSNHPVLPTMSSLFHIQSSPHPLITDQQSRGGVFGWDIILMTLSAACLIEHISPSCANGASDTNLDQQFGQFAYPMTVVGM
jgi:hypothetical protein